MASAPISGMSSASTRGKPISVAVAAGRQRRLPQVVAVGVLELADRPPACLRFITQLAFWR